MNLTIESIIILLKKSGCNSKKQVIELLENASYMQLCQLQRSVKEHICKLKIQENDKMYQKMINELERIEKNELR